MIGTPKAVPLAVEPDASPEVIAVVFDLWTLRITLRFPGDSAPTYVEFEEVAGFRVLDEGDLLEFWEHRVKQPGWLWHVMSGGWRELESTRSGFTRTFGREFLVVGVNDCVGVFSAQDPRIYVPAT